MNVFEFSFMLEFWNDVLVRFRMASKALQEKNIALSTCANLYKSLIEFVSNVRDKFEEIEVKAKVRLPDTDYKFTSRRKVIRRQQINDGVAVEVNMCPRDKFRVETFI